MRIPYILELTFERIAKCVGQDRDAIFRAFAVADADGSFFGVQVFDTQPQRFHQPQSAAIVEAGDEPEAAVELSEHPSDFGAGEDDWQSLGSMRTYHSSQPWQVDLQHLFIEKQQSCERLGLCCGGDMSLTGKM